ncbi:MAG: hypothetical protein IJZ29_00935 [Clostridia bacterium]|nr:hypothetical protein [Clostridia bacterium]
MVLNDNILSSYSKFIDFEEENSSIDEFKSVLEYGIQIIMEHLNMNFNYEIGVFGAYNLNTLATQFEPISFYIKIFDIQIYDNIIKNENVKSKNKKAKYITTDSIKMLLAIYLDKYFDENGSVNIARNSIIIDCYHNYGFNSRIYIFASNFENCIMLDTNNSKLLEVNIENFESLFLKKAQETNYEIVRVVNIVKNLCQKTNVLQEPFLIETLFYNVPNNYFTGSLREQFIKSLNYINFSNISNFNSLLNDKKTVSEDFFTCNSIYNIYKEYELLMKTLR